MSEAHGQSPHEQPVQTPDFLDLPPDPPAWPKVIGIISIVFGSLGIGCMGCSGVGLVIQPMFMGSAEAQFGPMPDVMKPPLSQIIMMPVGALLAAMLIIAGVLLLKRVAISRLLHLVYAALNIVMSILGTITGIAQTTRMADWKSANPDSKWAEMIKPEMAMPMLIAGLVIGLSYPLFLLVWFGAVKRKASDMGKLPEYL